MTVSVPTITADRRRLTARLLDEEGIHPSALMAPRASVAALIARAVTIGERLAAQERRGEACCRVCGCTPYRPCRGGCAWVAPSLCTACAAYPEDP